MGWVWVGSIVYLCNSLGWLIHWVMDKTGALNYVILIRKGLPKIDIEEV